MKKYVITSMMLLFLIACAGGRESYHLYDINSYKGEPGWISSCQVLAIKTVDNSPTFYLRKKYPNNESSSSPHLCDYYLLPGEHKITAQGYPGSGITINGDFTFKVLIEAGHKYVVTWEEQRTRRPIVYIRDLTTGEKVGTLQ